MKKRKIIFPQTQWQIVTTHFSAQADQEQAAFAYASVCQSPDRLRLLVNEVEPLAPEELEAQTGGHVIPSTKAIGNAVVKAVNSSRALVHLHPHLWHGANQFSQTDKATIEKNFLWGWESCHLLQAAVVTGLDEGAVDALVWSASEDEVVPVDELQIVGYPFRLYTPASAQKRLRILEELAAQQALARPASTTLAAMADRLSRAFGPALQRTFSQLRVGVVGLSGTGSHVSTELAHLGVEDFVLIDPQRIGPENADRIVGATYEDVGNRRSKVAVAERTIKKIRPWAQVEALECSVFDAAALNSLKAVDIVFGCTDNYSSRLVQNKLSRQYYLPYIDVGTGIFINQETHKITNMGGQVHIMLPETPCLDCRGALNREAAGRELMDEDQRAVYRQQGYVIGDEIIQPQVIQLNGLIANQALNECISLFTAFKEFQPYLLYDALKPGFLAITVKQAPACMHCHVAGSGDAEPVWVSTPQEPRPSAPTPASQPPHNGKHGGFRKWLSRFRTTPTSGK
jgi:hypothetical protein